MQKKKKTGFDEKMIKRNYVLYFALVEILVSTRFAILEQR